MISQHFIVYPKEKICQLFRAENEEKNAKEMKKISMNHPVGMAHALFSWGLQKKCLFFFGLFRFLAHEDHLLLFILRQISQKMHRGKTLFFCNLFLRGMHSFLRIAEKYDIMRQAENAGNRR